jgi:hypothetical protein
MVVLKNQFTCEACGKTTTPTTVSVYDSFDYSDPKTKPIKYLEPGTKAKIIKKKFPGILIQLEDGFQGWVCEWDVHEF